METKEQLKKLTLDEYLQTDYWKLVSEQVRTNAHCRCQLCGCNDKKLHIHFNTYEHRNDVHKHTGDLLCLCEDCHHFFHDKEKIMKTLATAEEKKKKYKEDIIEMKGWCDYFHNSMVEYKNKCDALEEKYKEILEERDYADWKLRQFYDAQKQHTRHDLSIIVEESMHAAANDDLPF